MNEKANSVLAELMADIPDDYDKREGSVMHTLLAPVAKKLAEYESKIDAGFEDMYADTKSLDKLILKAKERKIEYLDKTKSVIEAVIVLNDGDSLEGGECFFTADGGVRFTVVSISDTGETYLLECEEYGTVGNIESGQLVFDGRGITVISAEIKGIFTYGRNAETIESLRQRYYDSFDSLAFGGNITDYKEKALSVQGVGGVQVRRAWNGGGTVKLVLVSSNYTAIDEDSGIIQSVQNLFDPIVDGEHTGNGIATVEHIVTAVSAGETPVNIVSSIEFEDGVTLDSVLGNAQEALREYFISLCENWADTGKTVVRIGKIESVLSSVGGIIDAYDTTINGSSANIIFSGDNIPVLGTVNGI